MRSWLSWLCDGPATSLAGCGFRRLLPILVACAISSGTLVPPAADAEIAQPDGVCHEVHGTAVVISKGTVTPIGPLSPIRRGDRIIVRSGKVTIVDLATGTWQTLAAGSDFTMPEIFGKPSESPLDRFTSLLRQWFYRSLSGPRLKRIVGGSVRGGEPSFWPDGECFAPDVPPTLEWYRVCPPSALRLVQGGADTLVVALGDSAASTGGLQWPEALPLRSGRVTWSLLDAHGERVGGGRFEVLTPAVADSARGVFLAAARDSLPKQSGTLVAAVLAAQQHQYLW
jgi:hypothetical protein